MSTSIALVDYSGPAAFRRRGEVYAADSYDLSRYRRGLAMEDLRVEGGLDLEDCLVLGDAGIRTAIELEATPLVKLPEAIAAKLKRKPVVVDEEIVTDLREIPRVGRKAEALLVAHGINSQAGLLDMPSEYAEGAIDDLDTGTVNAISKWRAAQAPASGDDL